MGEISDYHRRILNQYDSSIEIGELLNGGLNNYVYKCKSKAGTSLVIKFFGTPVSDDRDKMTAELEFLNLASKVCPNRVPRVFGYEYSGRFMLTSFLRGSPITKASKEDVDDALDFIKNMNSDHSLSQALISQNSSEAFTSVSAHIKGLYKRYSNLTADVCACDRGLFSQALLLLTELGDLIRILDEELGCCIDKNIFSDHLPQESFIVSPSDFGFHNAIRTKNGLSYFDFEFSGWDNPCKALYDFALQPRISSVSFLNYIKWKYSTFQFTQHGETENFLEKIFMVRWILIILRPLNSQVIEHLRTLGVQFDQKTLLEERLKNAESRVSLFNLLYSS